MQCRKQQVKASCQQKKSAKKQGDQSRLCQNFCKFCGTDSKPFLSFKMCFTKRYIYIVGVASKSCRLLIQSVYRSLRKTKRHKVEIVGQRSLQQTRSTVKLTMFQICMLFVHFMTGLYDIQPQCRPCLIPVLCKYFQTPGLRTQLPLGSAGPGS